MGWGIDSATIASNPTANHRAKGPASSQAGIERAVGAESSTVGCQSGVRCVGWGVKFRHLLAILAAALGISACAPSSNEGEGTTRFRVGLDPTYPPFEMKDESGALRGVSVDLAQSIAEANGWTLELVPLDFQGLIPALQTGKIDAVISSMTRTEERARQVSFSAPYVRNGLALLVAIDSPIQSVDDLEGRPVVVRTGTTGHHYAMRRWGPQRVRPQELVEACVAEVLNGQAEAFLYDQLSVLEYQQRHPERLRALPQSFQDEYWCVALRKDDAGRLLAVNQALSELRENNILETLVERYPSLKSRSEEMREAGVPLVFTFDE